jgi:hypothetical protein
MPLSIILETGSEDRMEMSAQSFVTAKSVPCSSLYMCAVTSFGVEICRTSIPTGPGGEGRSMIEQLEWG